MNSEESTGWTYRACLQFQIPGPGGFQFQNIKPALQKLKLALLIPVVARTSHQVMQAVMDQSWHCYKVFWVIVGFALVDMMHNPTMGYLAVCFFVDFPVYEFSALS